MVNKAFPKLIFIAFLYGIFVLSCKSAFTPAAIDGDIDSELDSETDQVITEYNLKLNPDFIRIGDSYKGASISFKNKDELLEKFSDTSGSIPRWQINFGDYITFLVVRFDPENLEFTDIEMIATAEARTGERIVSVTISFGSQTITEYGKFYVLPAKSEQNSVFGLKRKK